MREIEGKTIGRGNWPVTRKIQNIFFETVRGKVPRYRGWLELA